jgi:hypothetical protein
LQRCINSWKKNWRRDAGLLEQESEQERPCGAFSFFYPRVHAIDASLVDRYESEHQEAKQLMAQLKSMSLEKRTRSSRVMPPGWLAMPGDSLTGIAFMIHRSIVPRNRDAGFLGLSFKRG